MLNVAPRAESKQAEDWLRPSSTSSGYAQDERKCIPLWERKCTNLLRSELEILMLQYAFGLQLFDLCLRVPKILLQNLLVVFAKKRSLKI
jgi:hypothetical protein